MGRWRVERWSAWWSQYLSVEVRVVQHCAGEMECGEMEGGEMEGGEMGVGR